MCWCVKQSAPCGAVLSTGLRLQRVRNWLDEKDKYTRDELSQLVVKLHKEEVKEQRDNIMRQIKQKVSDGSGKLHHPACSFTLSNILSPSWKLIPAGYSLVYHRRQRSLRRQIHEMSSLHRSLHCSGATSLQLQRGKTRHSPVKSQHSPSTQTQDLMTSWQRSTGSAAPSSLPSVLGMPESSRIRSGHMPENMQIIHQLCECQLSA